MAEKMTAKEARKYLRQKARQGVIEQDGIYYRITFGKSLKTSKPRIQEAMDALGGEIVESGDYQTRHSRFDDWRTYSDIVIFFPKIDNDPLWDIT